MPCVAEQSKIDVANLACRRRRAEASVSLWVADLGLAGRVGVGALFGCDS